MVMTFKLFIRLGLEVKRRAHIVGEPSVKEIADSAFSVTSGCKYDDRGRVYC